MIHEKSIDRELGELTEMVKTLTKKVDDLSTEFREHKSSVANDAKRDYKYLDEKIDGVSVRVKTLEEIHIVEKAGWWPKIKAKAIDVLTGAAMVGILGFIGYLFLEYVRKS